MNENFQPQNLEAKVEANTNIVVNSGEKLELNQDEIGLMDSRSPLNVKTKEQILQEVRENLGIPTESDTDLKFKDEIKIPPVIVPPIINRPVSPEQVTAPPVIQQKEELKFVDETVVKTSPVRIPPIIKKPIATPETTDYSAPKIIETFETTASEPETISDAKSFAELEKFLKKNEGVRGADGQYYTDKDLEASLTALTVLEIHKKSWDQPNSQQYKIGGIEASHGFFGDVSKNQPDLIVVESEDADNIIGHFAFHNGSMQPGGIKFPKEFVRNLNDEEKEEYVRKSLHREFRTPIGLLGYKQTLEIVLDEIPTTLGLRSKVRELLPNLLNETDEIIRKARLGMAAVAA